MRGPARLQDFGTRRQGQEDVLLALAPMEGISDWIVRDMLGACGDIDFCATEFIRVTDRPVSSKALRRDYPELDQSGRTSSGVLVVCQLLGGKPAPMAESATLAVEMGAPAIDLNFGCPAKTVNGNDGGAALLKDPDRVRRVVAAVRRAVVDTIPVSAKVRLGWDDPSDVCDIVRAANDGGATFVTIHGRTKVQMYKGAANWREIANAVAISQCPIVANGDIFDPTSFQRCRQVTGAAGYMLGRGAFRDPNLFAWLRGRDTKRLASLACVTLLLEFSTRMRREARHTQRERITLGRLKQWLRAMSETRPNLALEFLSFKRIQTLEEAEHFLRGLQRELSPTSVDAAATAATACPSMP